MTYPVSDPTYSGARSAEMLANPYSGNFIPEVWSGKLLEKFYAATVLAAIANTDYEGEIANKGDKVNIRTRPTIDVTDYEADQDLTVQRPTSAPTELLIDQGKYFNLALDDVMEIQSDIDQMSIWSEDAAEQMKTKVDTDVLQYLGATTDLPVAAGSNSGQSAGAISQDIRLGITTAPHYVSSIGAGAYDGIANTSAMTVTDFIVNCGQVLDEANIPESGRWMIIPAWLAAKIKKSELKDASLSGDGSSMLRNGRLGMVDRFTLYMSNLVPSGATGAPATEAGETAVFFGTDAALTFASQFTKMETIRSERSFSNLLRGLQVYGFNIVNPVAMGRAIVAKGNEG